MKVQGAFRHDPDVKILLATDAAGEGINLERAHLMVNYVFLRIQIFSRSAFGRKFAPSREIQSISGVIMPTTMVHVRVDEKTKQKAAKTLAAMGISESDAVRMLLVRVAAEKALPFDVKVPNAATVKAMRAADKGQGKRLKSADALFEDLGI